MGYANNKDTENTGDNLKSCFINYMYVSEQTKQLLLTFLSTEISQNLHMRTLWNFSTEQKPQYYAMQNI